MAASAVNVGCEELTKVAFMVVVNLTDHNSRVPPPPISAPMKN